MALPGRENGFGEPGPCRFKSRRAQRAIMAQMTTRFTATPMSITISTGPAFPGPLPDRMFNMAQD